MRNIILIAAMSVLLSDASTACASTASNSGGYHFSYSLGMFGRSYSREFSGNGMLQKFSLSKNGTVVSVRNLYHNNGTSGVNCFVRALLFATCREATIKFMDSALLVGRRFDDRNISFSLGVGRLDAHYVNTPANDYSVTGLALDFDWRFYQYNWFAVSANVSGNLNNKNPIVGAYLTLTFGNLN